jgi:DNA mismatch endonuclease, patch repair protein
MDGVPIESTADVRAGRTLEPTMRSRPIPKNASVSAQMSRMPRSSTGPEMALRRALHARGLRFRITRRDLPGTPDIVLSAARLAVFVDGCFWHGCAEHGTLPKSNREWWAAKLAGNAERDRRKDQELRDLGWTPLHLWEHSAVEEMAEEVAALWRVRTGRS